MKYYSYLNDEAKEFVINFYNETGDVLFTEKNKEPGSIYLNPDYVDYLGLSDEERSKYSIIPPVYKRADKKTPFDYNSSSSKNRFKSMVFSSVLTPSSFDLRNVETDRLFFSKCEYVYIKSVRAYIKLE